MIQIKIRLFHFFVNNLFIKFSSFLIIAFFSICSPVFVAAEQMVYPILESLTNKNPVFIQFIQDVESNYRSIASGDEIDIIFYKYKATKDDTLFKLAARCSLPYETIASINSIASPDTSLTDKTLLLPTGAGLYFCESGETSLDKLLFKKYIANPEKKCYIIEGKNIYYIKNARLSGTERAFFLDTSLNLPLSDIVLTSAFGMRLSPITGTWKFHEGIDLAAPIGTPVYACKSGRVIEVSSDNIYGNYIIIEHDNGMISKYAHLSSVGVAKNEVVSSGSEIGFVGDSGAATGPHLHFEIRINGSAINPETKL